MSYEGYTRKLCKNGHLWERDAYWDYGYFDEESFDAKGKADTCPRCGESCVWCNTVDLTNGSFDIDTGERIDGYIELEIERKEECKECGHITEVIYKIPNKRKQE